MQTIKVLLYILFLPWFTSKPLYSQTSKIETVGSFGISCSEYVNNMNRTWNISIPGDKTLTLSYSIKTEANYDKVFIYSINNSGTAVLQLTLSGSQTGQINSLYSNGKMRVVFTSDGSVNCSTNPAYSGFIINISQIATSSNRIGYIYDASGNRTNRTISLGLLKAENTNDEEVTVFTETIPVDKFEAEVRIFPNPTEGKFAVEISNVPFEIQSEIQLFDIQGRLLQKRNIRQEGKFEFDLSSHTAGLYILNIRLGEKVSMWKVIKN